jgi:hypothetical protein
MDIALMSLGRLGEARQPLERVVQSSLLPEQGRVSAPAVLRPREGPGKFGAGGLAAGLRRKARHEAQQSCGETKGVPDQLTTLRALCYGIGRIAPMTGDFVAAAHALRAIDAIAWSIAVEGSAGITERETPCLRVAPKADSAIRKTGRRWRKIYCRRPSKSGLAVPEGPWTHSIV